MTTILPTPAISPLTTIQIIWSGPFSLAEGLRSVCDAVDFGVYQIYGTYPEASGLLYIGRAMGGSFGWRFEDHEKKKLAQFQMTDVSLRLGRLAGVATPSNPEWNREIELAESLLIRAHMPPLNIRRGLGELEPHVERVQVSNWGEYGSLLPEVSGLRWTQWGTDLPKNIYNAKP